MEATHVVPQPVGSPPEYDTFTRLVSTNIIRDLLAQSIVA